MELKRKSKRCINRLCVTVILPRTFRACYGDNIVLVCSYKSEVRNIYFARRNLTYNTSAGSGEEERHFPPLHSGIPKARLSPFSDSLQGQSQYEATICLVRVPEDEVSSGAHDAGRRMSDILTPLWPR